LESCFGKKTKREKRDIKRGKDVEDKWNEMKMLADEEKRFHRFRKQTRVAMPWTGLPDGIFSNQKYQFR
jgi:hypothetical protein